MIRDRHMNQFAPVAPIQILDGLYTNSPDGTFGDYHLLLAHHTMERPETFHLLCQRIVADGIIAPTIIMDNSIVELGTAQSFEMVAAATDVMVNGLEGVGLVIPVLPDVMGDGRETQRLVDSEYDKWSSGMGGNGFMAVVQGKDMDEFAATATFLCDKALFPEITWLGIPRKLVESVGSRQEPIKVLRELLGEDFGGYTIHLLGFSDNMEDDIACAKLPGIRGIDSAVPLRIEEPWTPTRVPEPRDPKWFVDGQVTQQMLDNLESVRRALEVRG